MNGPDPPLLEYDHTRTPLPVRLWRDRFWRRTTSIGIVLVLTGSAIYTGWDYIPGTLRLDPSRGYLGSGWAYYHYPSGRVKLREWHFGSELIESTWFRPDGTTFAHTEWDSGMGVGYYLRDDGSVRTKMTYVEGVAHGPAEEYDEKGRLVAVKWYEHGRLVDPPTTQPAR
jgi:hypothetical protein